MMLSRHWPAMFESLRMTLRRRTCTAGHPNGNKDVLYRHLGHCSPHRTAPSNRPFSLSLSLSPSLPFFLGDLSILVADNDDFCGLQSKATFTSNGNPVRVLIDKYNCADQSSCMVSERRPGLLPPL